LLEYVVAGRLDSASNRLGLEAVDRIAGDDIDASARGFGIEARRAVAATEDSQPEIFRAQREHAPILVECSAPGDDLIQREHGLPACAI
jgi:hypothetical protein